MSASEKYVKSTNFENVPPLVPTLSHSVFLLYILPNLTSLLHQPSPHISLSAQTQTDILKQNLHELHNRDK